MSRIGHAHVPVERCLCGQPLHYPDRRTRQYMEQQVRYLGAYYEVATTEGTWLVPRHYGILHSISSRPWDLPVLAEHFGWTKIGNGKNGHKHESSSTEE